MSLKLRRRKSWADEGGVSEVVGNILILMITVVLFTTIIAFVNRIPVPEQQMKADFDATITFSGTTANLTLTHASGAALDASETLVIVEKDLTSTSYLLSDDSDFPYDRWYAGRNWMKQLADVSTTSRIQVTVFDLSHGMPVWTSEVNGGFGGNPPTILQRYADSDPLTPSVDPVKLGDNFTLAVKIIDLDDDLDTGNLWINSSHVEGPDGIQRPFDASGGGWFYWDFIVWDGNDIIYEVADLDGAVIMIHAQDLQGHAAESSYVLSVFKLPTDIFETQIVIPQSVGESGLPSYLTYTSGRRGFGVYGENITGGFPTGTANITDARVVFEKGELVFVRVGSLEMDNIFGENRVVFTDTRTGLKYTPEYKLQSTADLPFYRYAAGGSAYVYECKFNTSELMPSAYTMSVYLQSSSGIMFVTHQVLTIWEEGSPIPFTPAVWLYSDSDQETGWGTRSNPFVADGVTHKVYVSLKVQNAVTPPAPTVAEIRISDMIGDTQLHGGLPSGEMISSASHDSNGTAYTFEIDLRINNGDQWLGGINSYTLYISKFADENEGVYSLSKQIYVRASFARADFFTGTTGVYSSLGGSQNFVTPEYLYYIENNNFFTKSLMADYAHAPSTTPDYFVTALAFGDLDSDGDMDALMGQYESYSLVYFENSLNTYGIWQSGAVIDRHALDALTVIEWIACGDIDGDGDTDFATASSGNRVVIYNNSYGAQPQVYKTFNTTDGGLRKIDLKDMTNDGRVDLIALANGRIWVYDLQRWTQPNALLARLPSNPDSEQFAGAANGITDFDIEDMNGDGWLDILTVGDSGLTVPAGEDVRGVWVNNYTPNSSPMVKKLATVNLPKEGYMESDNDPALTYRDGDGQFLVIRENTSAENEPQGSVVAKMRFETLDTVPYDQTLYTTAQTNLDSYESFYAYYSLDGTYYSLMFAIKGTEKKNYSFPLPSAVAGKEMYLMFTDSNNQASSSSPTDYLYIDYIGVHSRTFGGYATSRDQYTTDTTFKCVRGGNFTGNMYLDVAYAKDDNWYTFDENRVSLWSGSDEYFYVTGTEAWQAGIAPTLFEVVDINGDGLSDILWTNGSLTYDKDGWIHKIGVFFNLYPDLWCVTVKDLFAAMTDVRGSITVTTAVDLTPEG